MSRFLAYTSPAAGHLFPLIPGLLELRRRGHEVHVATAPSLVGIASAAGLDARPVDERILAVEVADHELPERDRLRDGLAQLMGRGPHEIDDLRRLVDELRPDAVLVDTIAYGAASAAEASGLPWATTLPSLLPYPGDGIPPYGLGMAPRHDLVGRIRDRVLWRLVARGYGKAMLPPLNRLRTGVGLAELTSPHGYTLAPTRLIVLTGPPLEYPRTSLPGNVRMVGAQSWDPPGEAPAWLDEPGDPWVLVTCSTDYQADEALARAALDGLAGEPVRVVVTLADAYDHFDHPVPANARIERFVPHGAVLARAVAVVCPGGMGVVAKSVGARVPIVAVPFGRDQPEVARRVVEAGAGVEVDRKRLDAAAVRDAVRAARRLDLPAPPDDPAGNAARFADAASELVAAAAPVAAA